MHCCPLCHYTSQWASYVKRHLLVHTKAKTVPCDVCGKVFRTVSECNMHKKLHANEEHVCEMCGFRCKLKKVLDIHMLLHEDEKRIDCPHCHYRCRRSTDLKRHLLSMHSGKPRRKRSEEACCGLLAQMGVSYEREVVIRFPCALAARKFARVDLFWRTHFGAVVFEVDEYAHCGSRYGIEYECQRMLLIHQQLSGKIAGHLHIIRYNPHPIRGEPAPTNEEREKHIRLALAYEPVDELTITYLFYHLKDGYPEIALSPEYTLKEYIREQGS